MAKTASQIQAERLAIKNARDAIHEKQMADSGPVNAARTAAVLEAAGHKTVTNPKTYEVSIVGPARPKTKADLQYKREKQAETKAISQAASDRRSATKKAYDDYVNSQDYRKKQAEQIREKQRVLDKDETQSFASTSDFAPPAPERDETEFMLRAERDLAEKEYNKEADRETTIRNMEAITGLSNEERRQLEQYAVNQIRDQNLPIEMVGMMPTAQQEAATLIGKIGKQRADRLAETYMLQENADLNQYVERKATRKVDDSLSGFGIWENIKSVAAKNFGGLVGAVGQLQGAARSTGQYKTLDPNATGTVFQAYSNAVRDRTGEIIVDTLGDGILGQTAALGYQVLMGTADMVARMYMGGGAFGGTTLAATGSFSQTMADASKQGATPAQAALLATTTAGIEALTEKIPLDNLIRTAKGKGAKKVLKNMFRQVGIEVAEEEVSLFGTLLAEAAILQEKSSYQQDVLAAIGGGATPEEAILQASKNVLSEALNTALVAAASGGMSSLYGSFADRRGIPVPATSDEIADGAQSDIDRQQERIAAITQAVQQPQAEAQTAPEATQQQADAQPVQAVQQPQEAQQAPQQTPQPQTQQSLDEIFADMFTQLQDKPQDKGGMRDRSGYYDEFENWGVDPNREGVENPMADRKYSEVGKRDVKAYMYENPAVKPFYQEQAAWLLSELSDSTRGERTYNEQLHYDSGGEKGWSGSKRHTSDSIAELLDQDGMTYEQIEKGLNAIIHDNGQENNAVSKRIEFVINDRLMNGYTDFYTGQRVQGNAEYLNLLRNQQSAPTADMQMGATNQSAEGGQIRGTGAAEQNFSGKPTYNAILSEENAQPDRRTDVRPMELPKTDVNGGNVSATTANVYGSQNTPDDLAAAMEEPVSRGDYSYVRISNNAATERARQEIGKAGDWETARLNFAKDVEIGIAGAEIDARAALILNHAAEVYQQAKDSGDMQAAARAKKEWLGILLDVQKLGTNTGQGMQALKIIRNLAPQDKIQFAQMAVQNMVRDMRLNTDIQIDEQLLTEYESATTDQQRDEIIERIQQNVADQIPSTMLDKWNALRYTNMLGNLKTTVARNTGGNVANAAIYRFKDATGAVLESIANKVSGGKVGRTKSVIVNKQLQKAMEPYYQQVKNAIGSGGKYADNASASSDFVQGVMDKRRIFKNPVMEGYRKATNWMMNNEYFGDEAFGKAAFTHSLAGYLQANGIRNAADVKNASPDLMDRAIAYAVKEAQETTFHDNSALANVLGRLKKDAGIIGEGLLPFTKTPANVLTRAEEYSPLGILNTAILSAQKVAGNTKLADANGWLGSWAARGQDITGTDIINSLSKTLTGAGIFALGAFLKSKGILNGGPDDDEEQAAFDKMNGIQPYSINLPNGTTYTLDWLTPVAMPLFMGAQLMQIASEKDLTFADLEEVLTSIADPMIQMSMMQGINSSLEDIKYSGNNFGQFFMNAAVNYLTQGLTNTLLGQIERSTEEYRQTTFINPDSNTPQWMQKALGKASQKIPGWDYQQMDYVDPWGQKQKNEGGLLYNLLSPGYSSTKKSDAVTTELDRLRESTGESVFPDAASKTVSYIDKDGNGHDEVRLTEEQYQTLAQTQGQTARKLLEDMFKSASYKGMDDTQKAEAIKTAYQYARMTGEIAAIGKDEHTGYNQSWMYDVEKGGANEILRLELNSGINTAMGDLDNAWEKKYDEERFVQEMENMFRSYQNAPASMKKQVYAEAEGSAKKYIEVRDKGITHDDAIAALKQVATVKGTGAINKETGKPTIRDVDRRQAIATTPNISDKAKDVLIKAYMADYDPDAAKKEYTELKYNYIREYLGLSPEEYAEVYRAVLDEPSDKKDDDVVMALGYDRKTAKAIADVLNSTRSGKRAYINWYKKNM